MQVEIKSEYKANVAAQAICFILNSILYYYTEWPIFLWAIIACMCFIGITPSQPKNKFFDVNLFNHLIVVLTYYFLYKIMLYYDFTYCILIFIFTYAFFVLKDSGYEKSMTVWTYVQALLVATTFVDLHFMYKVLGTILSYIEVQLALFICFRLMPTTIEYIAEPHLKKIKQIPFKDWFDLKRLAVKLAIRGSITAGILYIICVNVVTDDVKPNWAVIVAISCLFRDDDEKSNNSMISCAIGSLIAWPIASSMIYFFDHKQQLGVILLLVNLLIALLFAFDYSLTRNRTTQILGVIFMILAVTASSIALDINSKYYLNLKMINNFIGLIAGFSILKIWQGGKTLFKK